MKWTSDGVLQFEADGLSVDQWRPGLEVDGQPLSLGRDNVEVEASRPLVLKVTFADQNIVWRITIEENESQVVIRSSIENVGQRPLKLGKAFLLQTSVVRFGEAGDEIVVLPWQPGQLLQPVYRLANEKRPASARIKAQFFNRSRRRAMQVGFLTFQRANTEVWFEVDPDGALTALSAHCDFAGWTLAPGASTETEVFRLTVGDDPFAQMEDWAARAGALAGANIRHEAPIGYLGWSWTDCTHGSRNYEQITLEVLDAINARLGGLGVRYLWTSMSNFEGSLPGNWLKWNDRCIPSGREAFIRQVQEKGFLPGFWVGPFYQCSSQTEQMDELKEAILKNPDGSLMVVCPRWQHGDAGRMRYKDRPCLYALDPSHPKALSYIRRVFETYRQWGVRYYMVDFLEAGAGNHGRFPYKEHFDESLVAGPEAYLKFIRTMKEAAGPEAFLLGSTSPTMHHAGALDGVRVGNDFGEGRALSPEAFFYPATFVINQLNFWNGPQHSLTNQAAHYHTHRRLYLNDSANVLTVDQPIPLNHARIAATIHAFCGGGTMLGDDIRTISEERLNLIKKTLPRGREIARPVDLFDAPHPAGPRVFHRRVDKPWQRFDVAAVYYLLDRPVEQTLDPVRLELDGEREYLVWDFWNEAFVGKRRGVVQAWVEAESVRVLRFVAHEGRPALLGTDMHLLMGEMEIDEAVYDSDTLTFRLQAKRPAGEKGMAFVYAPDNLYVKNFEGLHIAKDGRDNSLVIGVPLQFDANGMAAREIRFGVLREVLDMHKLDLA
jgi:hypothetical protein